MRRILAFIGGRKSSVILFFASFAMVILLAVCVLWGSINLYTGFLNRAQNNASINQILAYRHAAEQNLIKLSEVSSQVEYNSFVRNWINTSFMSSDLIDLKNILSNHYAIVTSNPQIFSIDIYNLNNGKVLSTCSGYYSILTPAPSATARSAQFLDFSNTYQRSSQYRLDISHGNIGLIVHFKYVNATNKLGIVAVSGDISNLLPEKTPPGMQIFLTQGETDNWIASVNEPGKAPSPETQKLISAQTRHIDEIPRQITMENKSIVNIVSYPIFSGQLTLHALFPQTSGTALIAQSPHSFILAAVVILITGVLLALGIVKLAYFPLRKLLKKAHDDACGGEPMQRLETLMERYLERERTLQDSIEMNKHYLHERMLRDLVFSGLRLSDARMPSIVRTGDNHFVIAYLLFSVPPNKQNAETIAVETDSCAQKIRASLLDAGSCEVLHVSQLNIALLLNCKQEPSATDLPRLLDQAGKGAVANTPYSLSIGMSNVGLATDDLPELYEQSIAASRSSQQESDMIVVKYQSIAQSGHQSTFREAVDPLIKALCAGTTREIDDALEILRAEQAGAHPYDREPFLIYIITYISRICQTFGTPLHIVLGMDPLDAFTSLQTAQLQFDYIRNLCEHVYKLRTESDRQYKRASVETAIQYLKANFDKPISLHMIANELEISPSYLSELLKKELDMNFFKYVQMLRMERAKELLTETTSTVKEIAAIVGYDSEHSFIRNFKAFERITPSQYRAQRL